MSHTGSACNFNMVLDLGPSSIIPETPSAKRQKTNHGYNTTLTVEFNCDDDRPRMIPETPDDCLSQPKKTIDASVLPPQSLFPPRKTPSHENVQVSASFPLSTLRTPSKENVSQSIESINLCTSTDETQDRGANIKVTPRKDQTPSSMLQDGYTHVTLRKHLSPKVLSNRLKILDGKKVELQHQVESSEDEVEEVNPNIIPGKFNRGGVQSPPELSSGTVTPSTRFQNVVQAAVYKGPSVNSKQHTNTLYPQKRLLSPDLLSKKVSNSNILNRVESKAPRLSHVRMERAQPINDISLDDIIDEKTKTNVNRLRSIFPSISVLTARETLLMSNGSFEQAASLLVDSKSLTSSPNSQGPITISISDDDNYENLDSKSSSEPQMKRTLKAPAQTIRDKYSSTQISHPKINGVSHVQISRKRNRRLIQGRRNSQNSEAPITSSVIKSPSPSTLQHYSLSDTESENEPVILDDDDGKLESRVLKYLNTCEVSNLVELVNISSEIAEIMLAARPFQSLDTARTVENAKKLKSGKKSMRVPIGDKIVDTALDMFRGYEAIDTLVQKCVELSKPLTFEISQWGFDVYGAQKNGELEMTSLNESGSFEQGSSLVSSHLAETDDEVKSYTRKKMSQVQFLQKPKLMAEDCILKDYQVVGMNWLALMSRNNLSGILADEMGLGKTCQVISFLAHLVETGNYGPHLVVCPGSTLENWLREISRFAPKLTFEPYHGPQKERQVMADEILQNRDKINVVVTTYDMAAKKEDNKFMRRLKPDVCVYDEGHMLKNVKSQRYQGLIRIPARFRILLTGTPLQNNLQELAALLAFILPDVFKDLEEDLNTIFKAKATTSDSDHAALLSTQRIDRARSILTPFVLRRKKAQVLKHLPAKLCRTEYCNLHKAQKVIYDGHLKEARERARSRLEGNIKIFKTDEKNPLMQLRKAAIHPLLFRRHFNDTKIEKMADLLRKKEPLNFPSHLKREHLIAEMHNGSDFWLHQWCRDYPCISKFDIPDLAWMDSGKVEAMMKLVKKYKENGDRVLIFSQFSLVLDIIEAVLNSSRVDFTRIDGSTKIDERQSLIDAFRDDESITVFLLTTKAGGTGINLMYANKVIIFDGSFNPQDDKQAENRAHRVGQTREVEVVRLVTKCTVEEQILALGESKLQLDGRVAGDDDSGKVEAMAEKAVARMILDPTISEETKEETEIETKNLKNNVKQNSIDGKKPNASRKINSILGMLTQKKDTDKIDIK